MTSPGLHLSTIPGHRTREGTVAAFAVEAKMMRYANSDKAKVGFMVANEMSLGQADSYRHKHQDPDNKNDAYLLTTIRKDNEPMFRTEAKNEELGRG